MAQPTFIYLLHILTVSHTSHAMDAPCVCRLKCSRGAPFPAARTWCALRSLPAVVKGYEQEMLAEMVAVEARGGDEG